MARNVQEPAVSAVGELSQKAAYGTPVEFNRGTDPSTTAANLGQAATASGDMSHAAW